MRAEPDGPSKRQLVVRGAGAERRRARFLVEFQLAERNFVEFVVDACAVEQQRRAGQFLIQQHGWSQQQQFVEPSVEQFVQQSAAQQLVEQRPVIEQLVEYSSEQQLVEQRAVFEQQFDEHALVQLLERTLVEQFLEQSHAQQLFEQRAIVEQQFDKQRPFVQQFVEQPPSEWQLVEQRPVIEQQLDRRDAVVKQQRSPRIWPFGRVTGGYRFGR